jgi:hypothetical protein
MPSVWPFRVNSSRAGEPGREARGNESRNKSDPLGDEGLLVLNQTTPAIRMTIDPGRPPNFLCCMVGFI